MRCKCCDSPDTKFDKKTKDWYCSECWSVIFSNYHSLKTDGKAFNYGQPPSTDY